MKKPSPSTRSNPRAAYLGAGLALARRNDFGRRSVVLGNSAFLRAWAGRRLLTAASKTGPEGTPFA